MKLIQLSFFLGIMAFFSCKSTQYTPMDFPEAQLVFGTGGGFSGIVTEYTLLENGQFFKKTSNDGQHKESKKVKRQVTKQLFNNYDFLKLGQIDYNHPGNLYYYITRKSGETEHTITWGDGSTPIDPNIKTFYRNLTQLVKDASFAPEDQPQKK